MDDDGLDAFEDEFGNGEEDNDEMNNVSKGDGFADMMSKILNQKTGDKIPVLAKRKTALMKEMEGAHADTDRLKRQRADKKAEKEKQLVVPDLSSADFERQLRKLATRGGRTQRFISIHFEHFSYVTILKVSFLQLSHYSMRSPRLRRTQQKKKRLKSQKINPKVRFLVSIASSLNYDEARHSSYYFTLLGNYVNSCRDHSKQDGRQTDDS
jgi:Rrp15p